MLDLNKPILTSGQLPPPLMADLNPKCPNVKELFRPDPGYILWDADLEQADAQIVAWESDDDILKEIFRDPNLDLHTENAKMIFGSCPEKSHPNRKKAKAGCFYGNTEVLTPQGWVEFQHLQTTDLVAQWDKGQVSFVEPEAFIHHKDYDGEMVHIQQKTLDLLLTDNHNCAVYETKSGKWATRRADSLPKGGSYRFETAGHYVGGEIDNPLLLALLVAVQADGHINKNAIRFDFHKERKKQRLEFILNRLNVSYTLTKGKRDNFCFYLPLTDIITKACADILEEDKRFGSWLLDFSFDSLKVFINELQHWDGSKHRDAIVFYTTDKESMEWVQTIAHLTGHRANWVKRPRETADLYQLHITTNSMISIHTREESREPCTNDVYCVQVPSGSIIIRQSGRILMVRNCHAVNYGVKARTLAKTLGITVMEAEAFIKKWFEIHPGIKEWHDRTEAQMKGRGYIENAFGNRKYFFGSTDGPTALSEALAWVPQSTVGLIINRAWEILDKQPEEKCQVLLQVHDSLVGQWRRSDFSQEALDILKGAMLREVPYNDPLIIGSSIEVSHHSWGRIAGLSWDGYWLDDNDVKTDQRCEYLI